MNIRIKSNKDKRAGLGEPQPEKPFYWETHSPEECRRIEAAAIAWCNRVMGTTPKSSVKPKAKTPASISSLQPPPEESIRIISPELEEAIAARDNARRRVGSVIRGMYKQRVARAANCGHGPTLHLRHRHKVQDIAVRPNCCSARCPFCWRRRVSTTLHRAAACLLDAPGEDRLPRMGHVHVARIRWDQWETLDHLIRRQHSGDVGRLRVRQTDDTVLVIAEKPFSGSEPVTPAAACDMAREAIGNLNPAKHSFRLLGAWSDSKVKQYALLDTHEHLDLDAVQRELAALRAKANRFATSTAVGLVWTAATELEADRLWATALERACPSIAYRDTDPNGRNSDSTNEIHTEFILGDEDLADFNPFIEDREDRQT
jgi:hypothetical protein